MDLKAKMYIFTKDVSFDSKKEEDRKGANKNVKVILNAIEQKVYIKVMLKIN